MSCTFILSPITSFEAGGHRFTNHPVNLEHVTTFFPVDEPEEYEAADDSGKVSIYCIRFESTNSQFGMWRFLNKKERDLTFKALCLEYGAGLGTFDG